MDYSSLADEALLKRLQTEEDFLPRAAVDEFVRRGGRMVPALSKICRRPPDDEEVDWDRIHAVYILGAMGAPACLEGILAAFDAELPMAEGGWGEEFALVLGSLGRPALAPLRERAENFDAPEEDRALAVYGLGALAARHEDCRGEVLDLLRRISSDRDEEEAVAFTAARALLRFADPADQPLLLKRAKRDDFGEFDPEEVESAFKSGPDLGLYRRDWLRFYDPAEIEARRRRAEMDKEGEKWADALWEKEDWVHKEFDAILGRYESRASGLKDLEVAREMMAHNVEYSTRTPWDWDLEGVEGCLFDAFTVWAEGQPESELRKIPGQMAAFLRFWASEGKLAEKDCALMAKLLEARTEEFVEQAQRGSLDGDEPEFGGEEEEYQPPAPPPPRMIGNASTAPPAVARASAPEPPGRNSPCPCGSGKKFKRCCG